MYQRICQLTGNACWGFSAFQIGIKTEKTIFGLFHCDDDISSFVSKENKKLYKMNPWIIWEIAVLIFPSAKE